MYVAKCKVSSAVIAMGAGHCGQAPWQMAERSLLFTETLTPWRVSFQFGAFHFGARQFDACQFGAFHFDAVPVRRVSVWRNASLARFTLARFPFLCLF